MEPDRRRRLTSWLRGLLWRLLPRSLTNLGARQYRIERDLRLDERYLQQFSMLYMQQHYGPALPNRRFRSELNRSELRIYSQNGEDGLLLQLFARLGTVNRRFVEFGIQTGRECNSANLSLNYGWTGLLMEANLKALQSARAYYTAMLGAGHAVQLTHCHVTPDNINPVLAEHQMTGEIDLLSIDIDSNDYWVWQALTVAQPRIVVIEYNAALGDERAVTIPYDPQFDRHARHASGFYFGASLAALNRLAQAKGYRLVACDSNGVNAFFVRQDVAAERVPALSVKDAFYECYHHQLRPNYEALYAEVQALPLVEV